MANRVAQAYAVSCWVLFPFETIWKRVPSQERVRQDLNFIPKPCPTAHQQVFVNEGQSSLNILPLSTHREGIPKKEPIRDGLSRAHSNSFPAYRTSKDRLAAFRGSRICMKVVGSRGSSPRLGYKGITSLYGGSLGESLFVELAISSSLDLYVRPRFSASCPDIIGICCPQKVSLVQGACAEFQKKGNNHYPKPGTSH